MALLVLILLAVLALDSLEVVLHQEFTLVKLVDLVVVLAASQVVALLLQAEVHIKAALGEELEDQLLTLTSLQPLVLVGLILMPLVVAAQRELPEVLGVADRLALVMAVKAAVAAALLLVPLVGLVALVPFLAVAVEAAALPEIQGFPAQAEMARLAPSACIVGKETQR